MFKQIGSEESGEVDVFYCLCFGQQNNIGQTRHYTPSKTNKMHKKTTFNCSRPKL